MICFTAFRLWDFSVSHAADQSRKRRPIDSRYSLWPQFHGDGSDHCWGCEWRPSFPPKSNDSDKTRKHPYWQCCVNSKCHWSRYSATSDYQVSAVPSNFHPSESECVFCAWEFACQYRIKLVWALHNKRWPFSFSCNEEIQSDEEKELHWTVGSSFPGYEITTVEQSTSNRHSFA